MSPILTLAARNVKSQRNPSGDLYLLDIWIRRNLTPIKRINPRATAYGTKHCFERATQRHCTESQFIDAMHRCGFHSERRGRATHFNVSLRSINAAWRNARKTPKNQWLRPSLVGGAK